ncbi:transcription factor Tfb4 [Cystobasidium minutum MCA 4210]|uniref:transcription factor Tfb4 n=1 Tax=Cystobasidium minutum MCA 4210 TaxID=1397322 RepID=UPI0034CFD12F|eukprot:jgi/Rhomi1/186657/estExt_fgenesh1_pm.C_90005
MAAASAETDPLAASDLLVVILDTNPFAWYACSQESNNDGAESLAFDEALRSVLVFCNAHLALRHENHLAIYSAGLKESSLLYSSVDSIKGPRATHGAVHLPPARDEDITHDANSYQRFRSVDDTIASQIRRIEKQAEYKPGMQDKSVTFASCLTKTLCYVNRISKDESLPALKARILVMSVSGEASHQYIPIMNCIFAAQKASIPIDVCKIYGEDAVFLQQAAHLTKASYYRLERRSGLLQYLMMAFLPGIAVRKHLHLPTQEQIDLRAACFCHKKIVDIGYVCSVCLSIFCSPLPVCTTCRTKFPPSSLKRLMGVGGASFGPAGKKRKLPPGRTDSARASPAPSPSL